MENNQETLTTQDMVNQRISQLANLMSHTSIDPYDYGVLNFLFLAVKDESGSFQDLINPQFQGSFNFSSLDFVKENSEVSEFFIPTLMRIDEGLLYNIISFIREIWNVIDDKDVAKVFDGLLAYVGSKRGYSRSFSLQPMELTQLMRSYIPVGEGVSVYNPFAGLGSLLLGLSGKESVYAQEIHGDTWALGYLRFMAYNIDPRQFYHRQDSIMQWRDAASRGKYDCIVSTPPFGLKLDNSQRAALYSEQTDMAAALLERYVDILSEGGRLVLLLPNSFLFAGGKARDVKRRLIREDLLDSVISLPNRLFAHTSIPVNLVVLDMAKTRPGVIQFVNAENLYIEESKRDRKLDLQGVFNLIATVNSPFSKVVTNDMVISEDCDLSPQRHLISIDFPNPDIPRLRLDKFAEIKSLSSNFDEKEGRVVAVAQLSDSEYFLPNSFEELPKQTLRGGMKKVDFSCILISSVGEKLKPTIFKYEGVPVFVTSSIVAVSLVGNMVTEEFFCYQMVQEYVDKQLNIYRHGSVMIRITPSNLKKVEIEVPDLGSQEAKMDRVKQALVKQAGENVYQLVRKFGMERESEVQEQNSYLRHSIAGPLSNLSGAILNIEEILKSQVVSKMPQFFELRAYEGSELTLGDFFKILKDNISAVVERTTKIGRPQEMIEDKPLSPIKILSFLKSYCASKDALHEDFTVEYIGDDEALRELSLSQGQVLINGNEELLKDMLDNFLENAEKHGFKGNNDIPKHRFSITVSIFEGKTISLMLSNTGNLLPANFDIDLFFRKGATAGSEKGDGFGGWYIHQILRKHGAELTDVDNEQEDISGLKGDDSTTFTLEFPLIPVQK